MKNPGPAAHRQVRVLVKGTLPKPRIPRCDYPAMMTERQWMMRDLVGENGAVIATCKDTLRAARELSPLRLP